MDASRAPLLGRHILLTRDADERPDSLAAILERSGAQVRSIPFAEELPPEDVSPLLAAAADLSRFGWVALSSARAAAALARAVRRVKEAPRGVEASDHSGRDAPSHADLQGVRWACVGPATARALLEHLGVEADLVPEAHDADSLATALLSRRPERVLFPAAENARPELPSRLRAEGVEVIEVVAYRMVPIARAESEWRPPGGGAAWDAIVFMSGLPVRALLAAAEASMGATEARAWLARSRPVVLGRSGEEALREAGIAQAIRPRTPDPQSIAGAILEEFDRAPRPVERREK